jgi:nitroreductase
VLTDQDGTVLGLIKKRRSVGKMRDEAPPRAIIEQIIQAAVHAPNHHKTEPWRFVVVAGAAREALGEVMQNSLRARLAVTAAPDIASLLEKERRKPLRAPVIVVAAALPSDGPKVVEIEEIEAVAAGVQNMLLAAEDLGLAAMWRTGAPAYDPAVKSYLGLPGEAHLVAFMYLGYPDMPELPPRERDAAEFTTWLGWQDADALRR